MTSLTHLLLFFVLLSLFFVSTLAEGHSLVSFTFYLTPYNYFDYLKEKKIADKVIKSSLKKSLQISDISDLKLSYSSSTDNTIYDTRKLSTSSLVRVQFSHKILSSKVNTVTTAFNSAINSGTLLTNSNIPFTTTNLHSSSVTSPSFNSVPVKSSSIDSAGEDVVAGAIWGSLISAIFLYTCYCVYRKYYKSEREII